MCSLFKIIFYKFSMKHNSNILLKCSKTKMGDVHTPYMSWLDFVHETPTMLYTRLYSTRFFFPHLHQETISPGLNITHWCWGQINRKLKEKKRKKEKKPTTKKKNPKRVRIFPCMHKFVMSKKHVMYRDEHIYMENC